MEYNNFLFSKITQNDNMPEILKSMTYQLASVVATLNLILLVPEVQAVLPDNILPYVNIFTAVYFAIQKNNQFKSK
jgi:hypothetical protein